MIELVKIKQFLRLDTDAEDMLLEQYAQAADQYVLAACGKAVNLSDPRAENVQLMLIADWFENRTMYGQTGYNRTMYGKIGYSQSISSMLTQLQLETEE